MCLISAAMMSWVQRWVELDVYVLTNSELFVLCAENGQILHKISVIPSLLTFLYLVALNLLVHKQPTQLIVELNSSLLQKLVTIVFFLVFSEKDVSVIVHAICFFKGFSIYRIYDFSAELRLTGILSNKSIPRLFKPCFQTSFKKLKLQF